MTVERNQSTKGNEVTDMGHNSIVARDQLRAFVERIERLEDEKKKLSEDIKDVYGEAKGMGYDAKILRKVISLRKKDDTERQEEEAILGAYLVALGMQPDLFND